MKLVPINEINPSAYNPRKADPKRLEILSLSLRKLGWLLPIYVDKNGEILSGHQRHHVAKQLGLTHVPVAFTKPFDLKTRKAINIVFNRGTNDLKRQDTPDNITEALSRIDLEQLAKTVPDKDLSSSKLARCLNAQNVPLEILLEANRGRWVTYTRNLAKTLKRRGIEMPIIATRDGKVVNGIGRLQVAAENKYKTIPVVWITQQEAALSDAMLNLLSMDFDIHSRYKDLLRYNSFRRARRTRELLGRGFVFHVGGAKSRWDVTKRANQNKWKQIHGKSILDFGAGHLTETKILRSIGCDVTPFEPYRLGADSNINKEESILLARKFLKAVADGKQWSSIFISSVLNSVPFESDRRHIACICAALCSDNTKLFAVASSIKQTDWKNTLGADFISETNAGNIAFKLDYEPGIKIGEISDTPKVQKYHTQREFYYLFKEFFARVKVTEAVNNVQAVCTQIKDVNPDLLRQAIEYEFNLPYPDGSTMGLVDEALESFNKRLNLSL